MRIKVLINTGNRRKFLLIFTVMIKKDIFCHWVLENATMYDNEMTFKK